MNLIHKHHVKISGRGSQALIFAHGYGCSQSMWRLVAPAFEDRFRVVLFDHVGSGSSELAAYDRVRHASLQGYAQDVIDLCRGLRLEGGIFVGHSVSAMIGLLAAGDAPELFERLVLIGPSPAYVRDGAYDGGFTSEGLENLLISLEQDQVSWARSLAPVIIGTPGRADLDEELAKSFCAVAPAVAQQFARVTFLSDNRKDLARVKTPSLILQCSQDPLAPIAVGEFLNRELSASELHVLRATGHCPHLTAPDETIAAIRAYLRRSVALKAS